MKTETRVSTKAINPDGSKTNYSATIKMSYEAIRNDEGRVVDYRHYFFISYYSKNEHHAANKGDNWIICDEFPNTDDTFEAVRAHARAQMKEWIANGEYLVPYE